MNQWGQLSGQPQVIVVQQAVRPRKDTGVAYLLLVFLGLYGAHRFYVGQTGMGILYLFTAGLCGIGWLVDLFLTASLVREVNARIDYEERVAAQQLQQMAGRVQTWG
jgi:TM2 domain-containing membrane protein YozV